ITSAITSAVLTITAAGVTIDTLTPLHLANGAYRFFTTGTYSLGPVTVTFNPGTFTDSNNYSNAAATEVFTVQGPTATLAGPDANAVASPTTLNSEGYLDVPFSVPAGKTIDPATVTDAEAEFTLSGAGTAGWSIDTTKAPVQLPGTNTFRYWTTGAYTSGTVSITFVSGSYGFTDNSTSTFTGTVAPANFTVDGTATPNIHYLDVQFAPTSGDTLDASSITDTGTGSTAAEFTLTGPGAGTVQLLPDAAPTLVPGTSVYRYYVGGAFAPGLVTVDYVAGSFGSGVYTNLAREEHFTLGQLTATIVNPDDGGIT